MAVDVEQRGAVGFGVDDVLVPDFVVEGASHGCAVVVRIGGCRQADFMTTGAAPLRRGCLAVQSCECYKLLQFSTCKSSRGGG